MRKRRYLWYILIFLILAMMQTQLASKITVFNVAPNFYIVFTACTAIAFGSMEGGIVGMISGLMYDSQSVFPFGTVGLILFILGFAVGLLKETEIKNEILLEVIAIAIMTFVYEFIMFTISLSADSTNWTSGMDVILSNYGYAISSIIWIEIVYNAILGVPMHFLVRKVLKREKNEAVVKKEGI